MGLISCGASTQSRATRPGKPTSIAWASGACEYTKDMRQILSWPMAQQGPLLGYPSIFNPHTEDIVRHITGSMNSGYASIGSYAPIYEEQLAEMLVKRYANYMTDSQLGLRFFSNGTDATQCAVALARYSTGRWPIISIGYHGGSSPVFNFPPQNGGVIEENGDFVDDVKFEDYLDWRATTRYLPDYAAIVVEVPPVRDELFVIDTLRAIESDCADHGIYFIMDEIVTGFRYDPAGALQFYSTMDKSDEGDCIQADFVCLGKALSTYGKVSALLGPKHDMDTLADKVFASYTFNDHPLGFLDAIETLRTYEQLGEKLYEHVHDIGIRLLIGLSNAFYDNGFDADVIGHPSRTIIESNDSRYPDFLAKMVDEHDILLHRPQFSTMAHTMEHVSRTVDVAEKVLKGMSQ